MENKSEIRISKSETITEYRMIRNAVCAVAEAGHFNGRSRFEPSVIRNWNLFRISSFGFRNFFP